MRWSVELAPAPWCRL